jgi:two-component system, OmpR family, sensor histidine kinase SenX3
MTTIWFVTCVVVALVAGMLYGKKSARSGGAGQSENTGRNEVAPRVDLVAKVVDEQVLKAFDLLPIGVVISRRPNGDLLRNRIATEMTGVRHVDILVDEAVVALVKETIEIGEQNKSMQVAGPPDRFFLLHSKRLGDDGVVVTIEDTTDRVRIDTVRTDFVANLSHELKTPIGGIAALGDTMMDETDPVVMKQLADRIVRESFRMAGIVNDLLDLSRIEFGRSSEWEHIEMTGVINEVVALLQDNALRHKVELVISGNFAAEVFGDRSQLISAFSNIVENAIKYSDVDRLVKIIGNVGADDISIAVVDQGLGIAPKDHERIFERFYRVDRARSRSTGGTGLGLSIVRHVVDNHGGNIEVKSNEGEGATFTVVLPHQKDEKN